jgi:RimJ/RimL family protein N-acetyltransferase
MTRSITTPRGKILIREASPADAHPFRELRLGALQDSPIAFSADYQKNLHEPLKHWEDMLTMHADESTIFLAEHERSTPQHLHRTQVQVSGSLDEKNLIGTTGIARGGSPKTSHSAWVWGVYVRPEWRGLHIAEELIRSSFAWAKARRIVIAKLGVAAVNQSAVRCYERCGFKIYGTEPQALFYDGSYYDFYMMSCSLDGS